MKYYMMSKYLFMLEIKNLLFFFYHMKVTKETLN